MERELGCRWRCCDVSVLLEQKFRISLPVTSLVQSQSSWLKHSYLKQHWCGIAVCVCVQTSFVLDHHTSISSILLDSIKELWNLKFENCPTKKVIIGFTQSKLNGFLLFFNSGFEPLCNLGSVVLCAQKNRLWCQLFWMWIPVQMLTDRPLSSNLTTISLNSLYSRDESTIIISNVFACERIKRINVCKAFKAMSGK